MDDFDADGLQQIGEIVAAAVERGDAPGVVAAVASGSTVHVATAGVMAVDGPPMREDTLFRIASITKPMTAAVVLSVIEDGLLHFDDPVEKLIPELADRRVLRRPDGPLDDTVPAVRPFTVRELLTFTWGLGMQGAMFTAPQPWPISVAAQDLQIFGAPEPGATPNVDQWIAGLAKLPLMVQPGEKWLYSVGSQLLGVVIARAAGKPFEDVMRERRGGELVVTDPPDGQWSRPPAFPDGAAGLVSTARDVVAFGHMLLRGGAGVLRPEMVTEMVRNRLTSGQATYDWGGFDLLDGRGWGYGLSVLDDGRYSWDGGLGTAWSNVPDKDLTVVVLTQRLWDETGPPAVCADVLEAARAAVR